MITRDTMFKYIQRKSRIFSRATQLILDSHEMEKWSRGVAVVTGANYGNGFAILKKLAESGVTVVGFDIVTDEIEKFKNEKKNLKVYGIYCDVTDNDATETVFNWVEEKFGGVDIMINNAGGLRDIGVLQHHKPMSEIANLIELNFTAVVRCARLAFKSMEARGTLGYIININSIQGHGIVQVDNTFQIGVYPGTKFAITATTEVIRRELVNANNKKIRITSLSPGLVKTNLFKNAGVSEAVECAFMENPHLFPEDIADNVIYLLSTPQHVNICELTIRPTGGNV